jgi:O-antigen/teichoic acid export membrane protein
MISKKPHSFMHTFLKGEAVSAFWSFITKGIGLLNTFLTISSLTLYQYGLFQLLLSVAGISSDAVNLGGAVVQNEMSRAVGENRKRDAKKIFIEYSIVRIVISIILWAVVYFGATFLFKTYSADFIKDLRIISFIFISEAIFMIMRTFWLVRLEFGLVALRSTLNKFIQSGILIYFFVQGNLGLKQLIWSIIIASSLSVVLLLYSFFESYDDWREEKTSGKILLWPILYNYGSWEIIRQFINKITFRIKPWLIKIFINTEAVAIFSIAEMIVTTLQDILPSKTLQSLVPLWIRDKNLSIKMFSYGVKYYVILGTAIALVSLLIVPPIVYEFFPKYNLSLPLYYFMVINLPIFAAGIIIGNYLIAFRKQKFIFVQHTLRNIVSLGIIFVTLPYIGLWGLALEFVLVPFLMLFSNYYYTKNEDKGFHFDFNVIFGFGKEDRGILSKVLLIIKGWFVRISSIFQKS